MTPPADLAVIRALVEAMEHFCKDEESVAWEILFDNLLPAAREALERIERQQANHMNTNDYTGVSKSPAVTIAEQAARIARLEEVLDLVTTKPIGEGLGPFTLLPVGWIKQARAELESRTHDADTAEWQRVHGATAQAARDVAHWRRRAENAEARLAKLEGRDA